MVAPVPIVVAIALMDRKYAIRPVAGIRKCTRTYDAGKTGSQSRMSLGGGVDHVNGLVAAIGKKVGVKRWIDITDVERRQSRYADRLG